MKHRIRVGAIVMDSNKILLVKHVHPKTGEIWWVPPGGGIKEIDDSMFDCAKREAFEETNLKIEASKIIYLREYLDKRDSLKDMGGELNIEIFVLADKYDGEISMDNIEGSGPDEEYIKEVKRYNDCIQQSKELGEKVFFAEVFKKYPEFDEFVFWFNDQLIPAITQSDLKLSKRSINRSLFALKQALIISTALSLSEIYESSIRADNNGSLSFFPSLR